MRWFIIALIASLIPGAMASAQTPDTAVESAPAVVEPAPLPELAEAPETAAAAEVAAEVVADDSTPRGAMLLLSQALEKGDKDAIIGLLAVQSDDDRKVADTIGRMSQAVANWRMACVDAFGEADVNATLGDPAVLAAETAASIRDAQIDENPDGSAELTIAPGEPPVRLAQVDGRYRVSIADAMGPNFNVESLDAVGKQIAIFESLTEEVKSGSVKSMQEVQQKLMKQMMESVTPETPVAAPTEPDAAAPATIDPAAPAEPVTAPELKHAMP